MPWGAAARGGAPDAVSGEAPRTPPGSDRRQGSALTVDLDPTPCAWGPEPSAGPIRIMWLPAARSQANPILATAFTNSSPEMTGRRATTAALSLLYAFEFPKQVSAQTSAQSSRRRHDCARRWGAIRGRSRRSLGARPTRRRPACAPICSPLRDGWRASRSVPCWRNADPTAASRRHRGACLALVERCPNPLVAGGSGGSRTLDLRIKSPLLCRLSYRPPSRLAGGRPVRRAAGSAPGRMS